MQKAKNASLWTEAGYALFAEEGLDGIQVERLARILSLNKSGFYHYFGDLECYHHELIKLHDQKSEMYLRDIDQVNSIDPGYLQMIIKHKVTIMFQVKLVQTNCDDPFYGTAHQIVKEVDEKEDIIICNLWGDFIGIHDEPVLAVQYFNIVRDMFYARLNFKDLNYTFLQRNFHEVKTLMQDIAENKALAVIA